MTTQALAPARLRLAVPGLAGIAAPIVIGLVVLGLLFHAEIDAAVRVWIGSTAYNHCFLIIPIAAYLVWDRRDALGGIAARPIPALGLAALPLAIAWFAAERIGFMEGRQLIAITCVELLFLAVLGWRAFWLLCGPLLYLFFLVPFGDFLVPALQNFTSAFVMHGLDLLGIVNYTDGYVIQIPEGTFFIAEACAGLRFLIASLAFGCLYALLIYRSPGRRLCFIAASLVVPVIANGFRALGIVTLGHLLGSAQAAETDHILYGWIFFSIVILILVAIGLPFRQDERNPPRVPAAPPAPSSRGPIVAATAVVVVLTALGPAAAFAFNRAAGPAGAVFNLASAGRCTAVPVGAAAADTPDIVVGRYTCPGLDVMGLGVILRAETFSARTASRPIMSAQARLASPPDIEDVSSRTALLHGEPWVLTQTENPTHLAASLLWENGHAVAPGLRFRLRRAWQSIVGGGSPIVLVVLTPDPDLPEVGPEAQRLARVAIETFLNSATGLHAALNAVSPPR